MGNQCCAKTDKHKQPISELVLEFRNMNDTVISIEYHYKMKKGFHKQMKIY